MKRFGVSTTAAGLLMLGMAGGLTLAPSAGATTRFLTSGAHAAGVAPSATSAAKVKPGSVWTMNAPDGGCNVWTFDTSGNGVTTDTGYDGTWTKPSSTKIKARFPAYPGTWTYKGTYSGGSYTGSLKMDGTSLPGTTLTPGATSGC
jgi:hypothetical protein